MRKSIALFIMATLLLPMLTFAVPVNASTGHPGLAGFDGSDLYPATTSVNVTAGQIDVEAIDNAAGSWGNLTIIFYNSSLTNPLLVDFSGAQFDLYMSRNGYSNLTSDDVLYASAFSVSDLNLPFGGQTYTQHNSRLLNGVGTFDLGYIDQSGVIYKILTGPLPFDITNEYKYIKIFDGSATLIAAAGIINILPAIDITPDYGPACAEITMTGVALAPNRLYNITFEDIPALAAQVYSDAYGKFQVTFNAYDFMNDHCEDTGYETLCIEVIDTVTKAVIEHLHFGEMSREIWTIDTESDYIEGEFGNSTVGEFAEDGYHCIDCCLSAYIFDDLYIEGDHWCPTSDITIMIDSIVLGTFTANATGYFEAEGMTIPILTMGPHDLIVQNGDFKYIYCINILPTLVVQPEEGPVGTTLTFSAYGFPANDLLSFYWFGYCYGEKMPYHFMLNATTGADGQFNTTNTWVVPNVYGGSHAIAVVDYYFGTSVLYINPPEGAMGCAQSEEETGPCVEPDGYNTTTFAEFFVTPSLFAETTEFAAAEDTFWVNGTGFLVPNVGYENMVDPDFGVVYDCDTDTWYWPGYSMDNLFTADDNLDYMQYSFDVDNNLWQCASCRSHADCNGDIALQLYKQGFRPGGHSVTAYIVCDDQTWFPYVSPDGEYQIQTGVFPIYAAAPFIVTTEGDPISGQLANISSSVLTINDTVATIVTSTQTIQTSLSALDAKIVALDGDVATIDTKLGTLQTDVSSLITKITALNSTAVQMQTALGTLDGKVTSVQNGVATIQTDLGTVKTNVASINGFLPIDMTPVWIAVVLSLIAAIAAIVGIIMIRSKVKG